MGKNNLAEEHWVPVPGYENYEISNMGNVVNTKTGRDLKSRVMNEGYRNVALYSNGVRREFLIHRLVAQAFFADYDDNIEVGFINNDKSEITVRNLTLGSRIRIAVRIVETGQEFESMMAAGEYLGGSGAKVSECINYPDKYPTYLGYHFEVVDK